MQGQVAGWPREGSSGPFSTPPRAPLNFPDARPPLGAGRRGRGRVLRDLPRPSAHSAPIQASSPTPGAGALDPLASRGGDHWVTRARAVGGRSLPLRARPSPPRR